MNRPRPSHFADRAVVFMTCVGTFFWIGYEVGSSHARQAPKVCAKIEGMKPISSTADECTYIMAPRGVAYWRKVAI